jgi:sulfur-oxidizing protein SoxX
MRSPVKPLAEGQLIPSLILRSRALARRLEEWLRARPSTRKRLRRLSRETLATQAPQDEVSTRWQALKSLLIAIGLILPGIAVAQTLRYYAVVGDSIPVSLTGQPGDAVRGRAIVINRQTTCVLCHSGPFPELKFQGDLAPGLAGSGSRWSEGQLRLRLVDAASLNPATIMPSYYRVEGLQRVGNAWRDKPILSAEQIEDVVAYLETLRE